MNSLTSESLADQRFDCENMGDVLGKEADKNQTSSEQVVNEMCDENVKAAVEEVVASSEYDQTIKEGDEDADDFSWLLSLNTEDMKYKKCKCEGCLRRFISCSTEEKNAWILLRSWKAFRSYMRQVYRDPPLEPVTKELSLDNLTMDDIIKALHMCDPYQLLQKIEEEVVTLVLESRVRLLSIIQTKSEDLAIPFVTGLIEEYVKLLSAALYMRPTIELLLGPQLHKFGLTWEVLNKHLYLSIIYLYADVQEMWPIGFDQLKKSVSAEDNNHELFHQYLTLHHEMNLVETTWKSVEPLILEYRDLKSRENETLKNLQVALKACFSRNKRKNCTENQVDSASTDPDDFCSECMSRRDCRCNECLMAHLIVCEKQTSRESPDSPVSGCGSGGCCSASDSRSESRSRSRSRSRSPMEKHDDHNCECHSCSPPPVNLVENVMAANAGKENGLDDSNAEKAQVKGLELYPHIHGPSSRPAAEPDVYDESFMNGYLTGLYNKYLDSVDNTNEVKEVPSLLLKALAGGAVEDIPLGSPAATSLLGGDNKLSPSTKISKAWIIPKNLPVKSPCSLTSEQIALISKSMALGKAKPKSLFEIETETSNPPSMCSASDESRLEPPADSVASMDDSLTAEEMALVKKALHQNQPRRKMTDEKALTKPKAGVCGKCSKHGNQGCGKNAEKHLAAIARLGLSKYSSRPPARCAEHGQHSHNPQKVHSCNKVKPIDDPPSSRVSSVQTEGDLGDCDDTSSQDDTCSERSNSTSTSNSTAAHKDPKHCDCCYCEVFGHGVPTVAPVSRNYQEMRERLRLRLKEKKSKPPNPDLAQRPASVPAPPFAPEKETDPTKEEDLDSLLEFIEGNRKEECLDEKKAAKRARQKQKKQEEKEEKERQEREAERQRLEALRRMSKKERKALLRSQVLAQRAAAAAAAPVTASPRKQKAAPPAPTSPSNYRNVVSVNNDGDSGAPPKMVTIRRVMEPYSSEPTVTITIKGSSPDKDQVLFTLNNSNVQKPDDTPIENGKSKKKKKKKDEEGKEIKTETTNVQKTTHPPKDDLKNKKLKKELPSANQPTNVELKPAVKNSRIAAPPKVVEDKKKVKAPAKTPQPAVVLNQKSGKTAPKNGSENLNVSNKNAKNKTVNGVIAREVKPANVGYIPGGQPKEVEVTVTSVRRQGETNQAPVYRLSEFLHCMKPGSSPPQEEISLESLKLPPGITITKIDGPATKTIRARENPGPVTKGHNAPLVMSHVTNGAIASPLAMGPKLSPINHPAVKTPASNVIVVDTGRLKQVMKENGLSSSVNEAGKKKKKKKKGVEEPPQATNPAMGVGEQATIIKTSDNMVTIRSPQLQHAIDMQVANANGISDGFQNLSLDSQDSLSQQMKRMTLADARAAVSVENDVSKKQKKKKKGRGTRNDDEVDNMGGLNYAESVFEPKDIDLDNGDIDDDERELEAFKRFCLQSVPPARKDKVKVNLNIKDIVLKKKSSAIGCS